MQTDPRAIADELDQQASDKEAEARLLREAAAVLRGERIVIPRGPTEGDPGNEGAERTALAEAFEPTRTYLTENDYLRVLRSFPADTEWNADLLESQLRRVEWPVASTDAVRTALGRLRDKGYLERVRHGIYVLTELGRGGSVP